MKEKRKQEKENCCREVIAIIVRLDFTGDLCPYLQEESSLQTALREKLQTIQKENCGDGFSYFSLFFICYSFLNEKSYVVSARVKANLIYCLGIPRSIIKLS